MITKPSDLKEKNTARVIRILLSKPCTPRVELAKETGLTKTTISDIINKLKKIDIIDERKGKRTGLVGKVPIPLRISKKAAICIGIGLRRKCIYGVTMGADGRILATVSKMASNKRKKDVLANLFEVIQRLLKKCDDLKLKVDAVGIGAPAPLDKEKGIIYSPYGLYDWENFALGELTNKKFDLPVFLINDADGGAFGLKCFGNCRNISSFVSLYFDEGIGAGIILKDEVYSGSFGYSGEISYTLLSSFSENGSKKKPFNLDAMVSTLNSKLELNFSDIESFTAEKIINNNKLKTTIKKAGDEIGRITALVTNLIGPEAVVVNGKLLKFGSVFYSELKNAYRKNLFRSKQVKLIKGSKNESKAFSTGAASYAIYSYIKNKALSS
ncbi:MAG: ROK family transcriptional regulator [Kosmotogaceae bacterium]